MGYKALITIDLDKTSDEQRDRFYEKLEELKWLKIKTLTTTWKCRFQKNVSREDACKELISDLDKAKLHSNITKVEYAFQKDFSDIIKGKR